MLVLNILLDKNRCYIIGVEFQVKDSLYIHSFIWTINESKLNKEGREFIALYSQACQTLSMINICLKYWQLFKLSGIEYSAVTPTYLNFNELFNWNKQNSKNKLINSSIVKRIVWKRGPSPGMTSKKTLLSLKGIRRFCANLDETKADMVQFTKRWN